MSRSNMSKQRSASRGRSSQSLNGETIDSKTRQTIFCKTTVCSIAKQLRPSEDAFQEPLIGKLLASQVNKRHAHGAEAACLEDRLNFKKTKVFSRSPFRNWVSYKDIEHFFVFPGYDTVFMLVIKSNTSGKSWFETYKCKTPEETTRIRRLVCQACSHPMKKLQQDNDNNRLYSTVSEVSLHENAISHPNLNEISNGEIEPDECAVSEHHSESDQDKDSVVEEVFPVPVTSEDYAAVESSPPQSKPDGMYDVRELSPISFTESNIELTEVHPVMSAALPVPPEPEEEDDFEKTKDNGITYFDYHPIKGAVMNDEGPIFMYVRRYPVNAINGYENGYH